MSKTEPLKLFSTRNVIVHYYKLRDSLAETSISSREFRKATEAYFVAEMLAGRRAADGQDYWLRLIDNKEQTPDIKTYSWKHSGRIPDGMWEHFIEVTEYEDHSSESLIDFLERTKLNKYRDDPQLIILCRVSKFTTIPPLLELKRELLARRVVNPILICGRMSSETDEEVIYRLIQIDPGVDIMPQSVDFNLKQQLEQMTNDGVLILDKLMEPGKYIDIKNYPFESLGFIPKDDGTYGP